MIAEAIARLTRPTAKRPNDYDDYWYRPVGSVSSAGIDVRPDTAMGVAAVFGCIRLLAETLAALPLRIYRRDPSEPRRKEIAFDHPLWTVLHERPNNWQTSLEWRELGMVHLALRGNFYNRIIGGGDGTELEPLPPDRVKVEQRADGTLVYTYSPPGGDSETIPGGQMLHIKGLSTNGVVGISVLEYARNAIGHAIAQETHGASLFKNGGMPPFWISRPPDKPWSKDQVGTFRQSWRAIHGGAENAGSPPILLDGMELHGVSIANKDLQWIESQGFSALQICRFFRVPPHMIAMLDRATFSNIECQSLEFVIYTMLPWAVRWEQALARDVVRDDDHFVKLVLEGLLRGDIKSRYEAYNVGIQSGFLTRNEVRELEDLNPIDGGDTALEPSNMVPAGSRDDASAQPPEPPSDTPPDEGQPEAAVVAERPQDAILRDAAARLASAEIRGLEKRAARADGQPIADWRGTIAAFYGKHRLYCQSVLVTLAAIDPGIEPGPLAAKLCEMGIAEMADPSTAAAVIAGWREGRAKQISTMFLPVS